MDVCELTKAPSMLAKPSNKPCAASSIANAVKAAMASALDIHSPSRWMRDMIGKNMMLGWMAGIDSEKTATLAKAREATDWMSPDVERFGELASKMSAVMIPNINLSPIRTSPQSRGQSSDSSNGNSATYSPTFNNHFSREVSTPSEVAGKQTTIRKTSDGNGGVRLMFKIVFENSLGVTIELFNSPFRLFRVEGLGDVGADIQMQKAPYQDGATLIDVILEPRTITIELKIYGKDAAETEANRRLLASVFNPKLKLGTLKYIRGDEVKIIEAVAESVPFFPDGSGNRSDTVQKSLLNLICPNPYWKSTAFTEEPAFEALFKFPFEDKFQFGMQRDQRVINNVGDAPAPLQIEFFGPALNPKIINNTTDEFIKINQELFENERMMIDTSDSSVYFVDEEGNERNVFPWIDKDTTFFNLAIGENDIEYTADSDIQGTIVNISYSKLFTAI